MFCDNSVLFYKMYCVKVVTDKKYMFNNICIEKTRKRVTSKKKKENPKYQSLMTGITTKSEFNEELCGVLLTWNIPLLKLNISTMILKVL